MNITVILSGGNGDRFGSDRPKQYHSLNGKEIIAYVFDAVQESGLTDKLLIVSEKRLNYAAEYIKCGMTHSKSVKNALDFIHEYHPQCKNVLFLDAVRPFVTAKSIDRYFKLLKKYDAVIAVKHITDSLGRGGEWFVDRSNYYLIQKPEAFRFGILYVNFSSDSPVTAIVQQLPRDARVKKCFSKDLNLKITYPGDLPLAESLMKLHRKESG
jgi:2-C-methyl-D-erythritol 4-phosphate cytidylyltransferase